MIHLNPVPNPASPPMRRPSPYELLTKMGRARVPSMSQRLARQAGDETPFNATFPAYWCKWRMEPQERGAGAILAPEGFAEKSPLASAQAQDTSSGSSSDSSSDTDTESKAQSLQMTLICRTTNSFLESPSRKGGGEKGSHFCGFADRLREHPCASIQLRMPFSTQDVDAQK